jgi:hypothetical protein
VNREQESYQEHIASDDDDSGFLRGNGFRSPVVSECSGHNLPAPFLQQETTLPQRSGLRLRHSARIYERHLQFHRSQASTIVRPYSFSSACMEKGKVDHEQDNQKHHPYGDGRRCSLRGNGFRTPAVSECSGHNLPAPFLHQDTTLP